jgi:NAD(P)-dependent dehydrogenase (short-subunit alcohol dehydrogenase family)
VPTAARGVATVLREFGQIDVLVNAAGDGPVAPLLEADEALWSQTVNGKMLGTIRMTRAVGRVMVERGSGRIVIVNGSFRKEPDPMFPINGTVNAGLAAFAKAASRDLGRYGVRVNVVDPGATDTALWTHTLDDLAARFGTTSESINQDVLGKCPMGVLPAPIDIAEVVSFLTSDACRYVNGASITVDGGASVAV